MSCMGSGHCCRIPCAYGEWNNDKTKCKHLKVKHHIKNVTVYECGNYQKIKQSVPDWEIYPAFGAGCCQPLFNTERSRIIELIRQGDISLPVHSNK